MDSPIKVLLTGASGTVGSEVLKLLSQTKEFELTVFDRYNAKSKKTFSPYSKHIHIFYGDISNKKDIEKLPVNLDIVIHLAAIIPPLAEENPELTFKVNAQGTKELIQFLEKTSPDVFVIYSSSVSVYGDRISNPNIYTTDTLKPSEGDIYAQSKIEAEEIIKSSQLKWSIFRLAAIMKNHKISKLMFEMPLNTILEICTPEDTALAFVNAVYNETALTGKVFNLGGGANCCITYREFLQKSFLLFGLGKLDFPAYAFADKNFHCGIMADSQELNTILKFQKHTLNDYFEQTVKSIPFLKRMLGFIFQIPIKWYLLNQSEPYKAVRKNNKLMIRHFFNESNHALLTLK